MEGYKYVIAIVEEATRMNEEWSKCIKKYGPEDKRTREAYQRYLGIDRARSIVMDLLEADNE